MPAPTGYLPPGVTTSVNSTIPVPASSPLLEGITSYNVVALGADPTGVADSTGAFSAADGYAANGGLTIVPPGTYRVNATMSHPGWVYEGAQLRPDAGKTLTFAAPWRFPSSAWWSGAGTVAISAGAVRSVKPEWFGAGPGVADSTAAINLSILLASSLGGAGVGGAVDFLSGDYNATELLYRSYVSLVGKGIFATRIRQIAGAASPIISSYDPTQRLWMAEFRDFALDASNNQAQNQGGLLLTGTQSAKVDGVLANYCNSFGFKVAGGLVGGDSMFSTLEDVIAQNSGPGCNNIWLSPTDASKPDGTKIIRHYVNSGVAGNVGIRADRGPTSGQGPEGCLIEGGSVFACPVMLQWAANDSAFVKNRWEQFSTYASNIVLNITPGTYDSNNGRNVFFANNYTFTGTYSGSDPLLITDISSIKSVRIFEGKTPATGAPFDWSSNIPYIDIEDKRLRDNGAGNLQIIEQAAGTPIQLDMKGSASGKNANIRFFNGPTESNARFWAGFDASLSGGAGVWYLGDGSTLDVGIYRNAAAQMKTIGSLALGGTLVLASYTTAGRPSAGSVPGGTIIYVSDASAGTKVQYSDGSAWQPLG